MRYSVNYRKKDLKRLLEENPNFITPLDIMVTGVTGAGKSTFMNVVMQKEVATVGDGVDPETMNIKSYCLNKNIRIWDTPGLGDGVGIDKRHKTKIRKLLKKSFTNPYGHKYKVIDLVLVIIEGSNRDMGTTYNLLNNCILKHIDPERVLVIVNQADIAMKGRHWDSQKACPDPVLRKYLDDMAKSIQIRIKEATDLNIPLPVCCSATEQWNITGVMDLIIGHLPKFARE